MVFQTTHRLTGHVQLHNFQTTLGHVQMCSVSDDKGRFVIRCVSGMASCERLVDIIDDCDVTDGRDDDVVDVDRTESGAHRDSRRQTRVLQEEDMFY